jgi:hypothetical protein
MKEDNYQQFGALLQQVWRVSGLRLAVTAADSQARAHHARASRLIKDFQDLGLRSSIGWPDTPAETGRIGSEKCQKWRPGCRKTSPHYFTRT